MPTESEVIETAPESQPETLYREATVFDADAERESDKNRRIAKELFPDNEDEGEIKAETNLPQPPAQRRRQNKADLPPVGEAPREESQNARGRGPDGKFTKQDIPPTEPATRQADETAPRPL